MSKSDNIAKLYRRGQPGSINKKHAQKKARTQVMPEGGPEGFCLNLYFYPLELLHFLHKTEMLSSVFNPPWAIDNMWSAVRSFVDPHLLHHGCRDLASLDIFCHS